MNKKMALLAVAVLSIGMLTNAYAHKSEIIGNYKIEVGWKKEPPIAGVKNAIEITVTKASTSDKKSPDHGSHDGKTKKSSTTKTAHEKTQTYVTMISTNKDSSEHKDVKKSKHSHKPTKKPIGITGLSKTIEADVTLNGKKTLLKLVEDKKNKGTYYGSYTPDSEGHPTVHVVGKIKNTPIEVTFHPEKVMPAK